MQHRRRIKDRRRYPRYLIGLAVEIIREPSPAAGLEAGVFDGRCVDLSRTAMRFRTRELFHAREGLELVFLSPEGAHELRCRIEVIRTTRVSRQYEVAARITRLLPIDESSDASS